MVQPAQLARDELGFAFGLGLGLGLGLGRGLWLGERASEVISAGGGQPLAEPLEFEWSDIDFEKNVITVRRSWDAREGAIAPKSRAGGRTVPIPSELRAELLAHRMRCGRRERLVFGRGPTDPFNPWTVHTRAQRAWKQAGLALLGLHEARHTYASLMIAAGVNAKALST